MKKSTELETESFKLNREINLLKSIEEIIELTSINNALEIKKDCVFNYAYSNTSLIFKFPSGNREWSEDILYCILTINKKHNSYIDGEYVGEKYTEIKLIGFTVLDQILTE